MSKYTVYMYSTYKLLFVHDMNVAFYLKDGCFCHEVISDAKNKQKKKRLGQTFDLYCAAVAALHWDAFRCSVFHLRSV